ncbi:hypothetical protein [Pleionea litopenaei]|uniref:Uncharacterized protein n=1 Tax=Pleionea litopenaei TaxID=3070815 RepID=A0AA51RUN9_9GAMM|nr:hypothetical protein [Pleionea sp. HL-JVS1]WMS87927.1 hypothetical protein Q9312_03160 [Pleionea sp. HL-JVS1]
MASHCRGCQREISWGNKDCPFCGQSNSSISGFLKFISLLTLFLFISGSLGYGYAEWQKKHYQEEIKSSYDRQIQELSQANQATENKNQELIEERSSLLTQVDKLKSAQSSSNNASDEQIANLKQQLDNAEQEAKRQEGRASWLGKENQRYKDELESLKLQVNNLQQQLKAASSQPSTLNIPETTQDSGQTNEEKDQTPVDSDQ